MKANAAPLLTRCERNMRLEVGDLSGSMFGAGSGSESRILCNSHVSMLKRDLG